MSRVGSFLARASRPGCDIRILYHPPIHRHEHDLQGEWLQHRLEPIVRGAVKRLVEIPFVSDDRQRGLTKMSRKEALGYFVQLEDLYLVRWPNRRQLPTPIERGG